MTDETEHTHESAWNHPLLRSIGTLWDDLGRTDSVLFGTVVNLTLAAIGVVVAIATSWPINAVGVAWALLNIYPVVLEVIR